MSSLLETVRGLIERTYEMRSGLGPLGPFVIGDEGLRLLYGEPPERVVFAADGQGARTLVRERADGVAARIYFPDSLIRGLEARPPQYGLDEANVGAFATFVEEIDHLLLIAERARTRRPVTLFELELHGGVSTYLVLARFLAGTAGRLAPERRAWLSVRLFEPAAFSSEDPEAFERYREAARWAARLVERLPPGEPCVRLALLRRFHASDLPAKLRLISALA